MARLCPLWQLRACRENFSSHGNIMADDSKMVYLSEGKKKLHIFMFSFSFLKAKCLMSVQQLAAKIKALFRYGKAQMERAPLSYVL